jgi:ubiquinone/menaquinone biosynthesis C-methylase UbiE
MDNVDENVDITNMVNFRSSSFDFLICSLVLEHVDDDISAIKELHRIPSEDGIGILMVPINLDVKQTDEDPTITDETERWKRFGQGDHVRIYSKDDFLQRLKSNGFKVLQMDSGHFGEDVFAKYGLSRGSLLYTVEMGLALFLIMN